MAMYADVKVRIWKEGKDYIKLIVEKENPIYIRKGSPAYDSLLAYVNEHGEEKNNG